MLRATQHGNRDIAEIDCFFQHIAAVVIFADDIKLWFWCMNVCVNATGEANDSKEN